jgi:hypothetical protein
MPKSGSQPKQDGEQGKALQSPRGLGAGACRPATQDDSGIARRAKRRPMGGADGFENLTEGIWRFGSVHQGEYRRANRPADGWQSPEAEPVSSGAGLGQTQNIHAVPQRCPQTPPGIRGLCTPRTRRAQGHACPRQSPRNWQ